MNNTLYKKKFLPIVCSILLVFNSSLSFAYEGFSFTIEDSEMSFLKAAELSRLW